MALAWTYRQWASSRPSFGSDEIFRHTLVLPWPLRVTGSDSDGTRYHPALVLVVLPWWACWTLWRDRGLRAQVVWERGRQRDLDRAGPDASDDHLDIVERRWEACRPAPDRGAVA